MQRVKNPNSAPYGNPGWRKGQSGNPGGRPKAFHAMAKLIRTETRDGAELVEFAVKVLRGEATDELKDGKSRRWAADWLSDRGFGKPMQTIEVSNDTDRPINLAPLTESQLEALASLDVETPVDEEPGDGSDPN